MDASKRLNEPTGRTRPSDLRRRRRWDGKHDCLRSGTTGRQAGSDAVSGAPSFFFGSSGAGKSVTVQTAIQLSTVYACVRVISETIASLPLGVYQVEGEGTKKATDHPLYRLLHDEPNSEMTSFVLREVMLAHLLLYGNSYCQIIRTGRNRITGLYPSNNTPVAFMCNQGITLAFS